MDISPEHFLLVADHFSEASLLLTPDGTILAANRSVERLGLQRNALIGRPLAEFVAGGAESLQRYLRECAGTRQPIMGSLTLLADGRQPCRCDGAVLHPGSEEQPKSVLLRLIPKSESSSQFAILNQKIRELTEQIRRRQQLEHDLWAEQQRLTTTLASIGDAVILTDVQSRIVFLNPTAEKLTGWSLSEAQSRMLDEVFHIVNEFTRKRAENPVTRVLRENRIVGLANHTVLIARHGQEYAIDDSAAPIREQDGATLGVVLVFRDISERRQMEVERNRLAAITESSEDAIIGHRFDGVITDWNAAAQHLYGFSAAETVGRRMWETIVPEKRLDEFRDVMQRVRRGERVEHFETLRVHRDGEELCMSISVAAIRDQEGTMIGISSIERDVSEQNEAEQRLRQSEERLRLALEAGRMGTWQWNIPENNVHWSPSLERLHGLEPGTFPGTFEAFQSDIHPEDRPSVLQSIRAAAEGRTSHQLEYRIVLPNGSIRWLEARGNLFCDDQGQPLRMVGTCMDITDRKRSESVLRFLADASQSLATLIDYRSTLQKVARLAVPDFADWCAVDMVNSDGTLQRLAAAHVDPQKLELAHELADNYPPRPDEPLGPGQVLRTGQAELVEAITDAMLKKVAQDETHLAMLRALGLTSYMSVPLIRHDKVLGVLTFVSAESGRAYGRSDLAVAEDLAHRASIAIENARLYSELTESDRRKDEFLAMLGHELRNPLAPIRSGLDILAMEVGARHEAVELMMQQVAHLVRLVDDLLDVSRIMRGKIELRRQPVELAGILKQAADTVREDIKGREHEFVVTLPEDPLWLDADPIRLVQVIENLLNNASKYTDPGGRIELLAARQGDFVAIRIRDNGIGIEAELLPKVFDLFTQATRGLDRSQGGLGIGLTLVRRMVQLHGGSVTAHSQGEGRGSEFVVRLPVLENVEAQARAETQLRDKPPGRRILVVDDHAAAAKLLKMLLSSLGDHQVYTAHDGPSALEAIKAHRPDVVFLDIGLPGMDGFEVARRIRRDVLDHRPLLIALTGYGQDEDRRRSKEVGFDEHLVKPPDTHVVEQMLVHPKLQLHRQ